jgi:hypothetical protein
MYEILAPSINWGHEIMADSKSRKDFMKIKPIKGNSPRLGAINYSSLQ